MVLMMSTEKGVSAFPDGENLFKWIGTIAGPRDTVIIALFIMKIIIDTRELLFSFIVAGLCWSYI